MLISQLTSQLASAEKNNTKQQKTNMSSVSDFGSALVKTSSQVNISPAARMQAQGETLKSGGFAMRDSVSRMDDKALYTFLKEMVYEDTSGEGDTAGGLLDITDWMKGGPLRYSNTGEIVTAESKAYFNSTDGKYRSQKISLFEAELNRGTSLLDIYDKLVDLTAQQPSRFLGMKGYLVKPT